MNYYSRRFWEALSFTALKLRYIGTFVLRRQSNVICGRVNLMFEFFCTCFIQFDQQWDWMAS